MPSTFANIADRLNKKYDPAGNKLFFEKILDFLTCLFYGCTNIRKEDMEAHNGKDWILDESGFTVYTPQLYRPWYNYISNGDYGIKISHIGDAYSTTLAQPRIAVSNYDFFSPTKGRFVFVRDGDSVWAPSYWPCKTPLDAWSCRHESGATTYSGEKNGIRVTQTVFVPEAGTAEAWIVTAENAGNSGTRTVEVFPEMEFLLYNSFNIDPVYYSWFTDTRLDEKGTILFERRIGSPVTGFFAPVSRPDGTETSLKRFLGNSDISRPESVATGKLSGSMSGGDPYIGSFKYSLTLTPGEKKTLCFFAGTGLDTLADLRKRFPDAASVEAELEAIRSGWKKKLDRPFFDRVSEGEFKNWLKTFFGYQLYQQSLGMVRGTYRGFRDVAQDIMGISSYDGSEARKLLLDLGTRMYSSGQCLRQWNTEGGANDERDFRDLPFWLIIALDAYERYTGDSSIYGEIVPYLDSPDAKSASLWEHALTGIRYALTYNEYGLVKMGAGDWNDALSGPGKNGGTTFLNQIAYYALTLTDKAARAHGFSHGFDIEREKQKLYDGVMKYWNGEWFGRAVTESGEIIGDKNDNSGTGDTGHTGGRIFLLPQVWFTISGMSSHDGSSAAIAKQALDSVIARLERPEGLIKCNPGYCVYDPKAGNLSALTPGMSENFAVYNHSAAFSVYAFLKAGRKEEALRILDKILPFTHDWKKTKAEPYVLVNFYNGGYYPEKAGEGGIPWLTGTVNWIASAFFDGLL